MAESGYWAQLFEEYNLEVVQPGSQFGKQNVSFDGRAALRIDVWENNVRTCCRKGQSPRGAMDLYGQGSTVLARHFWIIPIPKWVLDGDCPWSPAGLEDLVEKLNMLMLCR